jgi:hypothetical protein
MIKAWLAGLLGGVPGWLATFAAKALDVLLGQIRQGIDEARDDQAQHDLGVIKQKQADSEAARQAQDEANTIALEPRDRAKTLKRMRDGQF